MAAGLFVSGFAAFVIWKASEARTQAAQEFRSELDLPFTASPVRASHPAGFEWISAPAVFRDAAWFEDNLYLLGPSGLLRYDANGALLAHHRVGLELPAAPLVRLATGVAPGTSEPALLLATAGEGLLLFDGQTFLQIRPGEARHRDLTSVLPLATGRILLGTEKDGVLSYDGKRLRRFHPALAGFHVTALAGTESDLWVGTLDRGVLHWRGGKAEQWSEEEGLPDQQVLSLAVAEDAAYVGTPLGVAEFRDGRFVRPLAEGFFARSLLVREDTLVVGTLEEGTIEIPRAPKPPRYLRPAGLPLPGAAERLLEREGALYALSSDGLYRIEDRGIAWSRVLEGEDALLTDSNVSALSIASDGRLWVGYFDRGLDILEPGATDALHIENEHIFCVNRIVEDAGRKMTAVATANGLALFDAAGRLRQVLGPDDGLIANHVTDILFREGGMTVATPAGLTLVDSGGLRSLYAFHGLVNNHAYTLASAGNRLLVGTLGGLSVLEGEVIQDSYTTANSELRHNWITAVEPVERGWFVGTYGAGVLRLDSAGRWHSFPDLPEKFEVNPNALLVTPDHVFAGTLGLGLFVFDRASERWHTLTDGLPSASVTALAAHEGMVYVGTDNGLIRFPERSLPAW